MVGGVAPVEAAAVYAGLQSLEAAIEEDPVDPVTGSFAASNSLTNSNAAPTEASERPRLSV